MKFKTLTLCLTLLFISQQATSADKNGVFAVKGAGIASCNRFIESAEKQDKLYFVYGGWIEGFLTASNQHYEQTFDLAPWQSTHLLLKLIESACKKKPQTQFHQILSLLRQDLLKQRLSNGGDFIDIDGSKKYVYQEAVILRMKEALKNRAFFDGKTSPAYDDNLKKAVMRFQKSINQKQTGLPEQGTLFELFKPQPNEQPKN